MVTSLAQLVILGLKMNCPLCESTNNPIFSYCHNKHYFRCSNCSLIYLDEQFYLSEEDENKVYDNHQYDSDVSGPQNFLNRLAIPLNSFLDKNSKGLDFGCGANPILSLMLEREGHQMENYDKFYHDDHSVFSNKYQFIVMTEVIEHLKKPNEVLGNLNKLLLAPSLIGVMTKLFNEDTVFENWYYPLDPTHIIFLSDQTINWVASEYDKKILYTDHDNVVILGT